MTAPGPRRRGRALTARRPFARLLSYSPVLDGDADPGEVVWLFVTFEEDSRLGKDRPVLVVGREGRRLFGLMLSSRPRRASDQRWLQLGSGVWDRWSRPSWVRLDRVLEFADDAIRREGAVMERSQFDAVAVELERRFGWRAP